MPKINETLKTVCITAEIEDSIELISTGLKIIQNRTLSEYKFHLPILLLSSGIERLLKLIIYFGYNKTHDSFPTQKYLKNLGHNIIELKLCVLNNYYSTPNDAMEKDLTFLRNDENLNNLLDILSKFGTGARYYNLDLITGGQSPYDFHSAWACLEINFLDIVTGGQQIKYSKRNENYRKIKKEIIILIERFIRALVRQFTLGYIKDQAKIYSNLVKKFLNISDSKLGRINY